MIQKATHAPTPARQIAEALVAVWLERRMRERMKGRKANAGKGAT